MHPVVCVPKLWHIPYLVSKVSSDVFNLWIVTHINPSFPPLINSYDGPNVIRLTWSGNQVEEHTTQNCLEHHQYANFYNTNRRRSVSGIIHTLFGVSVFWNVQIQPSIDSESPDGEIWCMHKAVK